jgi:ubiquitin-protein ligase E3 C
MNGLGEALRGRVRIQYVNAAGAVEPGVDGGGLFKDYLEELLRQGFDPAVSGCAGGCADVSVCGWVGG